MSTALVTLTQTLSTKLNLGNTDPVELGNTLKATAFKGNVSDAQVAALLIVANQYGLNPWTSEIHAFPDKNKGIVPVVGVDGWSRIINTHPQFEALDFEQDAESCTCIIWRKDRAHPIKITEYLAECRRANSPAWQSHPRRMLRHKAMIQCARLAFGYVGIYDQDEAERIIEVQAEPVPLRPPITAQPARLPACPGDKFNESLPQFQEQIETGKKTPAQIVAMLSSKYILSEAQKATLFDWLFPAPSGLDYPFLHERH